MGAEAPPDCHHDCAFIDFTCYIPDCGGKANVNHQVVEAVIK